MDALLGSTKGWSRLQVSAEIEDTSPWGHYDFIVMP